MPQIGEPIWIVPLGDIPNGSPGLAPDGTEAWRFVAGAALYGAPALGVTGDLYLTVSDGKVLALTSSGNPVWSSETGTGLRSSPILAPDGTLYVGGTDGVVRSFFTANVVGPYSDVSSASPLLVAPLGDRERFYRLQR